MNKKVMVILFILILLTAGLSGCFGKSESKKKSSGPSYKEIPGEVIRESGWIDSDMGDTPQHVDSTISLTQINASTKITMIQVRIKFDDSDAAHAESDEGSDPDDVTITLSNGMNESAPVTGTTPATLELQMGLNSTEEDSFMMGSWEIHVTAVCGAGKPFTYVPRPGNIAFLQYKDQGIAYDIEVDFLMLTEE
jgi:hypothetical protein